MLGGCLVSIAVSYFVHLCCRKLAYNIETGLAEEESSERMALKVF
jgi:hypothetical protein